MMKAGVDLFYRLGAELAKAGVTEVQQRLIDAGDVSVLAEIFKRPTKPMLDPAGQGFCCCIPSLIALSAEMSQP